jgi:solute carrier family 25 uncoupling protein 8/9
MSDKKQTISPVVQMLISGSAASWGEICTIPFDTAKVRLQNQVAGPGGKLEYKGLLDVLAKQFKYEGVTSPWKGVSAGVQRQMAFAPIRIGLYGPVKDFYMNGKSGDPDVLTRIAAGLTTSAIGITVACPTDVVKVRLQAEGRLPPGAARRYTGAIDAYRKIVAQEGIKGLWTGYGPNLARNCVVNATELVAYDSTKQFLLSTPYFEDNMFTHIGAGLGAGLAATLLGSPVDVVKTRVMSAKVAVSAPKMAIEMLKKEGPGAFYKGFIPNFTRIGSWNIVTWVTLEKLKALYLDMNSDE